MAPSNGRKPRSDAREAGIAHCRTARQDCRLGTGTHDEGVAHARQVVRLATVAHAHCDLYCGVYDPAQAKIEAMSVLKIAKKYQDSDDEVFRARCILIKEQRAEGDQTPPHGAVGRLLRPEHFEQFPNLHELFWKATHQAGEAKKSMDPAEGQKLIDYIDEIADIFWQTDKAKQMGVYPPA